MVKASLKQLKQISAGLDKTYIYVAAKKHIEIRQYHEIHKAGTHAPALFNLDFLMFRVCREVILWGKYAYDILGRLRTLHLSCTVTKLTPSVVGDRGGVGASPKTVEGASLEVKRLQQVRTTHLDETSIFHS